MIALTFDDGPSEQTLKILDVLEKHNAHASFFVMGQNAEAGRHNIEYIPPEEIASAIKHIIGLQIGIDVEDLYREISKLFGFARCTESMIKTLCDGLNDAIRKNWVIQDDGRIIASI